MQTIIRTAYTTNASGASRIVAKGAGKQRTIPFDPAVSSDRNHGNAAGELGLALGLSWSDDIGHDSNDSGTKHGFSFPR
jgi:hypothetical protein